ncbi:MAG: UvrB/UvrC motif-containing protein [Lentisphaerae bacterium]|nr:UvrB/UvrC motif-containing protein [Lentisphaerota bacterium]
MMCEACGKKAATVHWTEMINDVVRKMHLCEACATAKGLDVNNPAAFSDVLLGLGAPKQPETRERDTACGLCHMRIADFKKTSRLGCQACYDTFADELKPLLQAMHKGQQHVGKAPAYPKEVKAAIPAVGSLSSLAALRQKLASAITAEQYEEAARLRDQIRQHAEKASPNQRP